MHRGHIISPLKAYSIDSKGINNYLLYSHEHIPIVAGALTLRCNDASCPQNYVLPVDAGLSAYFNTVFEDYVRLTQDVVVPQMKRDGTFTAYRCQFLQFIGGDAGFKDTLTPGDNIRFPYYISCTYKNSVANFHDIFGGVHNNSQDSVIILKIIKNKTARNWAFVGNVSTVDDENEIIIKPNVEFTVIDVSYAPCEFTRPDGRLGHIEYKIIELLEEDAIDAAIAAAAAGPAGGGIIGGANENKIVKYFGYNREDFDKAITKYKDNPNVTCVLMPDIVISERSDTKKKDRININDFAEAIKDRKPIFVGKPISYRTFIRSFNYDFDKLTDEINETKLSKNKEKTGRKKISKSSGSSSSYEKYKKYKNKYLKLKQQLSR
jgi:hypothetical protein